MCDVSVFVRLRVASNRAELQWPKVLHTSTSARNPCRYGRHLKTAWEDSLPSQAVQIT
jgi:hypothetical protein